MGTVAPTTGPGTGAGSPRDQYWSLLKQKPQTQLMHSGARWLFGPPSKGRPLPGPPWPLDTLARPGPPWPPPALPYLACLACLFVEASNPGPPGPWPPLPCSVCPALPWFCLTALSACEP